MVNQNSEPIFNLPPVVQTLCLLNVGVFLLGIIPQVMTDEVLYKLALVLARYSGRCPSAPPQSPLLTHMFIHANWLHLLMNVGTPAGLRHRA